MSSVASQIVDYVATTLRGIDGTGNYTFDLTATDKVIIADPPAPGGVHTAPMLYVFDVDVTHDPGQPLTVFNHTLDVFIAGFVQSSDGTQAALKKAALDMGADIFLALTADRTAGGLCYDVVPQTDAVNGASMGYKGFGVCTVRARFTYRGNP